MSFIVKVTVIHGLLFSLYVVTGVFQLTIVFTNIMLQHDPILTTPLPIHGTWINRRRAQTKAWAEGLLNNKLEAVFLGGKMTSVTHQGEKITLAIREITIYMTTISQLR